MSSREGCGATSIAAITNGLPAGKNNGITWTKASTGSLGPSSSTTTRFFIRPYLVNGCHTGFSADRLIALLSALEVDVQIMLRPRHASRGQRSTVRIKQAV